MSALHLPSLQNRLICIHEAILGTTPTPPPQN
jgi:hypothetical protein